MFINGKKVKPDPNYIPFETYPGKVGGMCIHPNIITWMKQKMNNESRSIYLEIGTFDGILLSILAESFPNKHFYAIDAFKKGYKSDKGHLEYVYANNYQFDNVHLYIGDSIKVLEDFFSPEKIDLVFIDGDHHPNTVSRELEMLHSKLHPNAIIALHDFNLVERAIHLFFERYGKWRRNFLPPELIYFTRS